MGLNVVNQGTNNTISCSSKDDTQLNGKVTIHGNGNQLVIGSRTLANNTRISLGSGCKVVIGSDCILGSLFIHAEKNAEVIIGANSGFNGLVRLLLHEPGRVEIGAGCLFASEIDVTISDMHSIIDVASGARVNPARNVTIGERVWIGQRAMILKGSHIESGSIIGAGSVVTGRIPPNSIAVGIPARVTRAGVTWDRRLL